MRDAYDNLFQYVDKAAFFKNGIDDIIYVKDEQIRTQWEGLQSDIFGNRPIYIRGYGRDALKTQYFRTLYKHLFNNDFVYKDATNNAQPTKLIKHNSNYCKITADGKNGKERIKNYQISHLFGRTKNPLLFNCAWNLAYVPKYLDPFTGHETQGDHSAEFKNHLQPILREKFAIYISEYNNIIEAKVHAKLDDALTIVKKELKIGNQEFARFEQDARNELKPI